MKTAFLLAAASAGAVLVSAPVALAQFVEPSYGPAGVREEGVREAGDWTLREREKWLEDRINRAHDDHALDGREADRAHYELDRLRDDEHQLRDHHDGQLTDYETVDLEARLDRLADQIHEVHEDAFRRPW